MFFLLCFIIAQVIVDINVEGNRNVDKNLIISTSGLFIGDELNSENIRKAIKKLYNTGLFKDINIGEEKKAGGVNLIIHVSEWPILKSVTFSGNRKINTKKLRKISELKEGSIISSKAIFDAKVKIKSAYKKKGYYLVDVTDKSREEDGKLSLKIIIDEGGRVKIKSIEFIGNEHFSDSKLRSILKNKVKNKWYRKGTFNEEKFKKDKENITRFYKKRGFPNIEIKDIKVVPDEERKWVNISIKIDEGRKFYIGNIFFKGNSVISTKILKENVKLKTGIPYNIQRQEKTLMKFYELYGDKGYMYAMIEPQEDVRDSLVDITYKITEGIPARVRKIIIEGNLKTQEKVIRREFVLFPGDTLRRNLLIISQRKVFNLGFFKDIKLNTRKVDDEGTVDLIVEVEEKQTGQIGASLGYSPDYGVSGQLSLSVPNFRGLGELVYIQWEKGQRIQNFRSGFNEPWLFDTPTSVGLDLYYTTYFRRYYDYRRVGGTIHLGRPIPKLVYTKGYGSYRLEKVEVSIEDTSEVGPIIREQEGDKLRSSIELRIVRDSRDNFLNATTGSRISVSTELSGGIFGGEVHYHKHIFMADFYERLFWRFVLRMNGRIGCIDGYTSSKTVPIYEKFSLGGTDPWGLRGYRDRTIGPGPMAGGEVIGGRFAITYTLELKLAFEQNIYPLVFFDIGNAWESFRECNITDLKRGVGIGIRIEIPMMGMLGFDFGYGFDKPTPGWEPHFQMGSIVQW